jgi:hypothetical protein
MYIVTYISNTRMNQVGIFKPYYKSLKGAPIAVLKEAEEMALAVVEGFRAVGDKQSLKVYERDLKKIRELMEKSMAE